MSYEDEQEYIDLEEASVSVQYEEITENDEDWESE